MIFHLIRSAVEQVGISVYMVWSYCRESFLDTERHSFGRRLFTDSNIRCIREIYVDNMFRRLSLIGS